MKKFLALMSVASTVSGFAGDQIPSKEIILKSYKDLTSARLEKELSDYYLSLLKGVPSIKTERDALAKIVNDFMAEEVVTEEAFIYSSLKVGSDFRVLGNYEGGKLKCKEILTESHAYAVFEGQSWKRSTSIAFGSRINVNIESCIAEDKKPTIKDKRVVLSLDYIDMVDPDKKVNEL
jgi:hypothetical protein